MTTRRLSLGALLLVCTACASAPVRIALPPAGGPTPGTSVQSLYEAGRDDDVLSRAATRDGQPETIWFAAQSRLRMGQQAEAIAEFTRLAEAPAPEAFHGAAQIALARLRVESDPVGRARAIADAYPADPFVQFELGLTLAASGDQAGAARAFDATAESAPTFAYAYYQAGLAYSRIDRADLTVARFELFVRLAPSAPERAQVESILRTARGR